VAHGAGTLVCLGHPRQIESSIAELHGQWSRLGSCRANDEHFLRIARLYRRAQQGGVDGNKRNRRFRRRRVGRGRRLSRL
jgi:hypothetical protein